MAAFKSRHGRGRRWWLIGTTVAAAAVLAVFFVAASSAKLQGSSFESNDGNLIVNTAGNQDWVNAPNRVRGNDLASGASDNSFGQGTKEDDANVTVGLGSIPPNKSDLTRFYVASDFVSNSNYLYLAWERSNVLGSANMDFEINQASQPDLTTTGPKALVRTAGDLLITFDFTNGGGNPILGLLKWATTGATSQCFSANSLPCWANRVNLSAAGFADGAVNTVTVNDPIANVSLPANTFGEAGINLTAAGVFPAGTCEAFGSAFLKSRSSASFPAEVKDFVAPQPVAISNCGTINVHKVTENGDGTFGYTTTGGLTPSTFTLSNGGTRSYTGTVLAGNYTVQENSLPTGWTLRDLSCTATGSGTSATPSGSTASIAMNAGGVADCTYTNHRNNSPTIATTLSANPVDVGSPVHDSSALTGATSTAGGTVTYTAYTDSACSLNARAAGTKTVTNGVVPNSDPLTFNAAGDFYWQAVYSGDANNDAAASVCTEEHLVVNRATPGISTAQNLLPNDSATISGATSNAGGTVTFKLFSPSDATCSGTPALSQTVSVSGNGTYVTTNTAVLATATGTWRWLVTYSGDTNNVGNTSACGVENFTITNG
jgi:hypothetical protein